MNYLSISTRTKETARFGGHKPSQRIPVGRISDWLFPVEADVEALTAATGGATKGLTGA